MSHRHRRPAYHASHAMRLALCARFGDMLTAKRALLLKTGGRCWICHRKILPWQSATFDHVHPRVYGGTHAWDNLMPAHKHCNSARAPRGNLFG